MGRLALLFCLITVAASQIVTVCDLITGQGYPCEVFQVPTIDGFLLTMMRIPHGINDSSETRGKRPAAYLQHGLLDSAAAWVVNSPQQSLGFILADAGFDVFLGNVRGNTWSSNNTIYPQSSTDYWNLIDFDNMIAIDLPTMIDAVLEKSGQSQTVYIGHSQGTLMGFGGFPNNTALAAKVSIFIALAPVAWVYHQTSVVLTVMADLDSVLWIEFFGYEDFLPNNEVLDTLGGLLCKEDPSLCVNSLFLIMGYDPNNIDTSRLPLYISYTPAGTSVRNMAHWSQMVRSGKFRMYDYGYVGNYEHYGQLEPPSYAPQSLTSPPVALFSGGHDDLADPADVAYLESLLPKSNLVFTKNVEDYDHLDFTWGENAHQIIYPDVVRLAQKYSQK